VCQSHRPDQKGGAQEDRGRAGKDGAAAGRHGFE